jgi:hypothetical protein
MSEDTRTIEDLLSELHWWESYIKDVRERFKDKIDQPSLDHIEKCAQRARTEIARIKKLIADKRAGRGDREKKEDEVRRRKKSRSIKKR